MNCRKVSHLMSAYMDGELPGVEHRQIHEHLHQCRECQEEYVGLLRIKRLLAGMRMQMPREELPALILNRLTTEDSTRANRHPGHWFPRVWESWRQKAPSPPVLAFSMGLAVAGVLLTFRASDSQGDIVFSPANPMSVTSLPPAPVGDQPAPDTRGPVLIGNPAGMLQNARVPGYRLPSQPPFTDEQTVNVQSMQSRSVFMLSSQSH